MSNRSNAALFDDLVSELPKLQRHIEAVRLCYFEIDDKLELAGPQHRQVAGLPPLRMRPTYTPACQTASVTLAP
jgi:hypothetical protein